MISKMASENPRQQVNRTSQDEEPGRKEMEAPCPAIFIKHGKVTTHAYRGACIIKKGYLVFPATMVVVPADGQFKDRWCQTVSRLPPVEPWVDHENKKSAISQGQETQGYDPVSAFHPALMPTVFRV